MHRIAVELNKTGQGRVGGLQGHDMKTRIVQTIVSAAVLVGLSLAHPAFCAPQQQGQQHNSDSVSYEQFLGRDSPDTESTSTATATVPTWTAEPGQEGGIQPSERVRAGRVQRDDPELQRILPDGRTASRETIDETVGDLGRYLRPIPQDLPSKSISSEQRIVTILSIAAVAILGALGGIGVAFFRYRYGTRPDPARRTRLIK